MESLVNFITSPNVMALLVSLLIFTVTLILVGKRVIGFLITLLLLLFTLLTGLTIANQDLIRNYIRGSTERYVKEDELKTKNFRKSLLEAHATLKVEMDNQIKTLNQLTAELKILIEEIKEEKKK